MLRQTKRRRARKLQLYLSDHEYLVLIAVAARANLTRSELLRQLIRQAASQGGTP